MRFHRLGRTFAITATLASSLLVPSWAQAETLSAEAALRVAAAQNPTLKAALLDAAAARQATQAEENARVPTFVASVTGSYSESLAADSRSDNESISGLAGVQYTTDIGTLIEVGMESAVGFRNVNAFGTSSLVTGPTTSAEAYLSVRQPLLRGAGEDAVLAGVAQARASQTQAEIERDLVASQTALEVMTAYWELWYAERAVAVQEQALSIAKKQLADAQAKEDQLGTGSKIDVLSFASSEASIEEALSSAKTTRDTRAIALGKALGVSPSKALELSAGSEPPQAAAKRTAPNTSELAKSSPELLGLRSQLELADVRIASADDADQLKLDAFGRVGVGALWTTDSYDGFALPGGRPAFTVLAGLELEIPMGESRASAEAARARTQKSALEQRYQAKSDALSAQASSLAVELGAADKQVELSTKTATISAQLAEAERQRLELGTGSPTDVVKAEQSAREAELKRLRAIVSRATSELELDHTSGALIDRFGSVFQKRAS